MSQTSPKRTVKKKKTVRKATPGIKLIETVNRLMNRNGTILDDQANEEHIRSQKRIALLIEQSGAGQRHLDKRLNHLCNHAGWTHALVEACKVIDGRGMVALLGERGSGKTQLAVELIKRHCLEGRSANYFHVRQVGMLLREAYRNDKVTETDAFNRFLRPDLLVIDEVQDQPDKDFEQRSISLILDARYRAIKPTILIGNMSEKVLMSQMGQSVADRFQEGGQIVVFDWPSFRGAGIIPS